MSAPKVLLLLSLLISVSVLVSPGHSFAISPATSVRRFGRTSSLFNDKGSGPPVPSIKSGRKELAYDEASGRFYEASDREECESPEDEFCAVDKATGKLIRLTLEEKERIFLDSLQVRHLCRWDTLTSVKRVSFRSQRCLYAGLLLDRSAAFER
jgi:hypothetical protein